MTDDERNAADRALLERVTAEAACAPSAHNTQPWSPRIVDGPDGAPAIDLGVARGRTLPAGDPTGRDTLVSLGAWTEAAAIAAGAAGRALRVELLDTVDDPSVIVRAERDVPVVRLTLGDELPADGAADRAVRAGDLRRRMTYRGEVDPAPGFLAEARRVVPDWIRLVPVDAADLRHFSSLGSADTWTRPGVVEELARWLRLSPRHPRHDVDGLSAETLLLPAPVAAVGALATRRRRLRDGVVGVSRVGGDLLRRLLLEIHLDAAGDASDDEHFVLVADANGLDLGRGLDLTRTLNSPLGLPAEAVFEAGRALMRVWLVAARSGVTFAPHSEVLDSSLAAGELQYRLGLARRDVPLFVTAVGRPRTATPPRSARRPVGP